MLTTAVLVAVLVGTLAQSVSGIGFALVCGPLRGIPFGWTCIDMSFGVIGVLPLLLVRRMIARLAAAGDAPAPARTAPGAV